MNKKYIIRKNEEISDIVKKGNKMNNNYYVIYYRRNEFKYNRYCVSVSKKIGKANVRNLFKRRVKDILMKNSINNSCDYVIILKQAIIEINYEKMKIELFNLLKGEKE